MTSSNDSLPELVPARMVNEYVYCPRLAYMEWVQGEWKDNPDTADGRHTHRRVDREKGDLPIKPENDNQVIHARSITLSDPHLGLIAKLDLVETEGKKATPVDYKKGKRPHIAAGAYDPERVQLCAQGLLLRKHGYETDSGILYYAGSTERVHVAFDDELVKKTEGAILSVRALRTLSKPPEPLPDSPKCPRCSLVSICLPDEVNWFKEKDTTPRPISVRDEEQLPVYVQAPYAKIRKKGEELIIEADDQTRSARIAEISHLALFGNAYLTTPALTHLMQSGIPVTWHTLGGWYYGQATGLQGKNIGLRIQQYRAAFDEEKCIKAAKSFVHAKILNSRTLLRRNWRDKSESSETLVQKLKFHATQTSNAKGLQSLLGIEGQSAALYFSGFAQMLQDNGLGGAFKFTHRNRRPPKDPINAMLSYGYSLLTRTWAVTLRTVGFDPFMGFYHQPRANRPALALDMMEPFRPLIVDSSVVRAINNEEIGPSDFISRAGACSLTPKGRKTFIGILERRLGQSITHPAFTYRLTYRRLLELEARLLGRWLSGEIPQYKSFVTR